MAKRPKPGRKVPEGRPRSVDEAAFLLGISRNSAYEAVKSGQIPSFKIGKRILIPDAPLQRLIATGSV